MQRASDIEKTKTSCPCGSGRDYAECCGPFHSGLQQPATAESLMRSRYTAYVYLNAAYLQATWHPSTRPQTLMLEQTPAINWLGLKILRTQDGREQDSQGQVAFEARYKQAGKAGKLRENSRFIREAEVWFYLDGEIFEA